MAIRMRINAYPKYAPHISRYIRHMSDNADIRIGKYIRMAIPNIKPTKINLHYIIYTLHYFC